MGHSNIRIVTGADGDPVSAANPFAVTPVAPVPSATTKATISRGLLAPAAIATPERLAAVGTYVQTVTIWAMRAARVANAGSVFIDAIGTNDLQLIELTPGAYITFTAPPGKVIDLGDIYVDSVTLTDGVFFLGLV